MTRKTTLEPAFRVNPQDLTVSDYLNDDDLDTHYDAVKEHQCDLEAITALMRHYLVAEGRGPTELGANLGLSSHAQGLYREWFADIFELLLQGASGHAALGIGKPHFPLESSDTNNRNYLLAAMVHRRVYADGAFTFNGGELLRPKKGNVTAAISDVIEGAQVFLPDLEQDTVREAWEEFSSDLDQVAATAHADYLEVANTPFSILLED